MSRNSSPTAAPPRDGLAHRAAGRVFDILEFLGESPDGFTLAGLSRRLRVPKSSLLALLKTFVDRGYLERQPTGADRLGPRVVEIGLRPPRQREFLDLVPFTDATVTDRGALRVRLDEIRSAGVAVNIDEFIAGAGGVAAPIFDAHGAPVAACTVIGPTPRLLAQRDALVRWVKAAGDAISRNLGCLAAAPRPS